jgi:LPPG:FO 2-phospho-L-lactate transferase
VAVARYYDGLLESFVLDVVDEAMAGELAGSGLKVVVTDTIMRNDADRARLAQEVLALAGA